MLRMGSADNTYRKSFMLLRLEYLKGIWKETFQLKIGELISIFNYFEVMFKGFFFPFSNCWGYAHTFQYFFLNFEVMPDRVLKVVFFVNLQLFPKRKSNKVKT